MFQKELFDGVRTLELQHGCPMNELPSGADWWVRSVISQAANGLRSFVVCRPMDAPEVAIAWDLPDHKDGHIITSSGCRLK